METLPLLTVVTDDVIPPYEQLRRQLTQLIESGALAPGQRLPPLRQLAGDLGLAVGTVARTYRELEADGLITAHRGGGSRVTKTLPEMTAGQKQQQLREYAFDYVLRARLLGAQDDTILDAVSQAISKSARTR
jgi:DNA-binding transcriptional regulator YhcF (GntR family)